MSANRLLLVVVIASIHLISCRSEPDRPDVLGAHLTFYASFDNSIDAEFALGDPTLYEAPSWNRRGEFEPFTGDVENIEIQSGEGRYRDALRINSGYEPVFFFRGMDNMPYAGREWSGTISFWLRLDPDRDLATGYSDPIQITTRSWNDGSLFVDFTEEEPRIFRFAVFPDRDVWDPDERDWDDVPLDEHPMVYVTDPPFSSETWTHVALTFTSFNTGRNNGRVNCYLNGQRFASMVGREKTFTWEPEEIAIWLGYNYRGFMDELSIFDRMLTEEEILRIYNLGDGIREILPDEQGV